MVMVMVMVMVMAMAMAMVMAMAMAMVMVMAPDLHELVAHEGVVGVEGLPLPLPLLQPRTPHAHQTLNPWGRTPHLLCLRRELAVRVLVGALDEIGDDKHLVSESTMCASWW